MASDAISRRYELLNRQLQQKERGQLQQEQEGLQRRFAAIGGLGSGASIKTQQIAAQESAKRLNEGRGQLGIAESQERQQQDEIEKQRAFQTAEREAGQGWQSGESEKQRGFLTSERLGGQNFSASQADIMRGWQSGESEKQRGFLTSERLGGQEFTAGQNALARRLQEAGLTGLLDGNETLQAKESRLGREQQANQFTKQLEQEKVLSDAGRKLQEKIANAELDYKNANLAWEKYVFNEEFPINKQIAFANLELQKKMMGEQAENQKDPIGGAIKDIGNMNVPGTNASVEQINRVLSQALGGPMINQGAVAMNNPTISGALNSAKSWLKQNIKW